MPASRPTITSRSRTITTRCRSKLFRETVDARFTGATVEVFHKGQRIASHAFSAVRTGTRRSPSTCRAPSPLRRMVAGSA